MQNPDGSPAAGVVVCFDNERRNSAPLLTDEAGHFEFQPRDLDAGTVRVRILDPHRPLSVLAELRLDQRDGQVFQLEEHEPGWLLDQIIAEEGDGGAVPAISLRGKIPPELEGGEWLNTGGKPIRLADLRGKYVLLVLWIAGCPACEYDIPSMQLVDRLYKDKGVVVIGVNTGIYQMHEEDWRYQVKTSLRFPVVVDGGDRAFNGGPITTSFRQHGVSRYLSHVLIGPDGTVLLDDVTIPYPPLSEYKLEIMRDFLLGGSATRDAKQSADNP